MKIYELKRILEWVAPSIKDGDKLLKLVNEAIKEFEEMKKKAEQK